MQIEAPGETAEDTNTTTTETESASWSSASRANSPLSDPILRIKVPPGFWNRYDQFMMAEQAPDEPPTKRQKFTPIPEPEPIASADEIAVAAAAAAAAAAQGPHRHTPGSQPQPQPQPQQEPPEQPAPRPVIMDIESDNKEGILPSDISSLSDSSLASGGDTDIPYSMAPRATAQTPLPATTSTPNGSQNIAPPPSAEKAGVRVKTPSTPAPESRPSVMVTVVGCGAGNFPVLHVTPNSQLAASLRDVPCTRPLTWRNGTPRELRNQWTRDAAIYFSRGELAPEPCTSCVRGRGPFEQCVRPPNPTGQPPLRGACASCIWTGNPRTCSFHPDHLLHGHSHSTPSKLADKKTSLVPRTPRTPNASSSSATLSKITTSLPRSSREPSFNPHRNTINTNSSRNISSNINNNANHNINPGPGLNSNHNHNQNQSHSHSVNHMNSPHPNASPVTYHHGMQSKNVLPVSPAQTNPSSVAPSPPNPLGNQPLAPPHTQPQPHRTNPFPHHCYFNIPEKLNGGNLTEVRKAIHEMDAVQAKLRERAAFLEQLGDNWQ
ncbi:hypothetical protein MGYG_07852 [Nannizzia gypsea CBS 118893]|uniref:Uncharacterized protein n=1 Tax=Arthroderma gypseum (strain ATCC MYA-4604 / CBS 118893) TaxID=535722 RepID=E4V4C4_ARTGP|nr:hypothetical protein MGYG_07852 [Nannizzia gypsea CBS 118893]EFR04848.1 hypothetical protein MGYG_07852 [Nannizzia gypsea CBS 118893]